MKTEDQEELAQKAREAFRALAAKHRAQIFRKSAPDATPLRSLLQAAHIPPSFQAARIAHWLNPELQCKLEDVLLAPDHEPWPKSLLRHFFMNVHPPMNNRFLKLVDLDAPAHITFEAAYGTIEREFPEDPYLQLYLGAALAVQAQKSLMLRADRDGEAQQALELLSFITGHGEATTLLKADIPGRLAGNDAALALLRGVPSGSGLKFASGPNARRYYQAGDTPEIPEDLAKAGLKARILGPPSDHSLLKDTDSDPHQYLRLAAARAEDRPVKPFADSWNASADELPLAATAPYSAVQIERMVQSVQPEALWAAAKKADNTINNQSLVVLFSFGDHNLLFVGDAQWGNWEGFLFGKNIEKKEIAPELQDDSQQILATLDFYKVGHHGSTNATPMDAVAALRQGCVAMCSTQPGCYGKEANGTEVPRAPLLAALGAKTKSRLVRSDQVPAGNTGPTSGLPPQLPPHFSSPGALYIDYEF